MSAHYLRSLPAKADIRFSPQTPQPWEWYSQFWPEFVGFIDYTSYWTPLHPYLPYLQDQREMLNSQLVLVSKLELAVAIPYRRAGALLHHIVTIFSIGQPNYST
ncbi:hypothetical protein I7I51_06372, partial [Histoplasma capsulatum]